MTRRHSFIQNGQKEAQCCLLLRCFNEIIKLRLRINPPTPIESAVVPCALALLPFARFQNKFAFSSLKCPLTRGKLLCPFKSEVQGLFLRSFCKNSMKFGKSELSLCMPLD